MLSFEFHLQNAARGNSGIARVREQTRMALVCHGMRRMGYDAVIANCSQEFRQSNRWRFFHQLEGRNVGHVRVVPTEAHRGESATLTVSFKTSARITYDHASLSICNLGVFHEHDPALAKHHKLLPVPFMVHTDVMDHWIEVGLFEAYMNDDLETIRKHYLCKKDIEAGFFGAGHYGRKEKAAGLPNWCQFRFYDSPPCTPEDYLRWIARCKVGFNMEGETPKSYRFSELTVLGIVNAAPECASKVTPRLDATNSILMRDWNDAESVTKGIECAAEIVSRADKCYREGWSPTGQGMLIGECFKTED